MDLLIAFFQSYGYAAVLLVLVICGFGVPIPEDITLVSGGVISGLGYTNEHVMFGVGMLGVLLGDSIMYWLGRIYGQRILNVGFIKRIVTPERLAKVEQQFEKYGMRLLFIARFLPGLRAPIYMVSGITRKVSYLKFALIDGFAAVISVPIWVYLGYYGASNLGWIHAQIQKGKFVTYAILAVVALVVGVKYYLSHRKKKAEKAEKAEK